MTTDAPGAHKTAREYEGVQAERFQSMPSCGCRRPHSSMQDDNIHF